MKVLIIGSGGREHALAWKFKQSKKVKEVYVLPGNSGMKDVANLVNIDLSDLKRIVRFAREEDINLTFVGPEQPLVDGIVDLFQKEGLTIFGPTKKASQIEGSKLFAKELMRKYHIPTADYVSFCDYEQAKSYIMEKGTPIVIKADGLASGKGVVVAMDMTTAISSLKELLKQYKKVVIEEYLSGEEFSLMAFINEENVYPMAIAQDHKRAFANDLGPNTGGMGAYSPVKQISDEIIQKAISEILIPTAKAMVKENCSFTGILYAGLISTNNGPKVIEFNARFGDPEAEVILPRLKGDLYEIITDILENKEIKLTWDDDYTLGVVLASVGYPGHYQTGFEIEGLNELSDVLVFHMGTKDMDNKIITNGGRVLIIVSKENSLEKAREKVYQEIKKIKCDQLFYRTDIGFKALGGNHD